MRSTNLFVIALSCTEERVLAERTIPVNDYERGEAVPVVSAPSFPRSFRLLK